MTAGSEPLSVWGTTTPSLILYSSSSQKFPGPVRSTNDQALRLRPRLDAGRQRQLLDVDHGNVVRTAHRNERRLAVLAEPDVGAALPDRQTLHFLEGPRVENLGEGVLAIRNDRVAPVAGPRVRHRLLSGRLRRKHRQIGGVANQLRIGVGCLRSEEHTSELQSPCNL